MTPEECAEAIVALSPNLTAGGLERAIASAIREAEAAETERCVQAVQSLSLPDPFEEPGGPEWERTLARVIDAIRARGTP